MKPAPMINTESVSRTSASSTALAAQAIGSTSPSGTGRFLRQRSGRSSSATATSSSEARHPHGPHTHRVTDGVSGARQGTSAASGQRPRADPPRIVGPPRPSAPARRSTRRRPALRPAPRPAPGSGAGRPPRSGTPRRRATSSAILIPPASKTDDRVEADLVAGVHGTHRPSTRQRPASWSDGRAAPPVRHLPAPRPVGRTAMSRFTEQFGHGVGVPRGSRS